MAVNKVTGRMLRDNLERFGENLIIDNDLLVFDVVNRRMGINAAVPANALSVTGTIDASEVQVDALTFNGNEIQCSDVAGLSIDAGGAVLDVNASRIINASDPINGKDLVTVDYLTTLIGTTSDRIVEGDSSLIVNDEGGLSTFTFTLDATPTQIIDPLNTTVLNNLALTNMSNNGNDLVITTGTDNISIVSTSSLVIPAGSVVQRPAIPATGAIRFNLDTSSPEVWDGVKWSNFTPDFVDIENQIIDPNIDAPLPLPAPANTYQLNKIATAESIFVSINGVVQEPVSAYTIYNDTGITFSTPLQLADIVSVRFFTALVDIKKLNSPNGSTSVEATTNVGGDVIEYTVSTLTVMEMHATDISTNVDIIPAVDGFAQLGTPINRFASVHTLIIDGATINGGTFTG